MQGPKKRQKKDNMVPSLSSMEIRESTEQNALERIKNSVFSTINNNELEKALDSWLKNNQTENKIVMRDLSILKSNIMEYLDAFIMLGYDLKGNRVIIQNFKTAKDRDAVMEFFKTVFIKQQQDSFLDGDE